MIGRDRIVSLVEIRTPLEAALEDPSVASSALELIVFLFVHIQLQSQICSSEPARRFLEACDIQIDDS